MLSYAYADESGDTGYQFEASSSPRFVVGIVIPDQPEQVIDQLLMARRLLGRSTHFEFHFRQSDAIVRQAFFAAIEPLSFKAMIAVIHKQSAPNDFRRAGKLGMYSHALAGMALRSPIKLDNCKLHLDGAGHPKTFLRELRNAVRFACRAAGKPHQNFHDIRVLDSANSLVQCADMITGAAAEDAEYGHSEWLAHIASKVVLNWQERFDAD